MKAQGFDLVTDHRVFSELRRVQRLPVRDVKWLPDRRVECQPAKPERYRSPITLKGHNAGVKPPNWKQTYPAEPLTPAEVLKLMDACDGSKSGVRNRALIVFLWRTGLRISEALALRTHHVDFDAKTVVVLCGKGNKRRTVGIDPGALAELSKWLMLRWTLRVPADAPLFCTVNLPTPGGMVHPAYCRHRLQKLGRAAGIAKRVHPHGLRHSLACDLVRERVPVYLVQRQLGHSNLGTTDRYLQGIAPYEVIDVVSAREWSPDRVESGAPTKRPGAAGTARGMAPRSDP